MAVKPLDLEKLASKAKNIYEAIAVMSRRARQINEDLKLEFNQRLEMVQTKITENPEETPEVEANPDQMKISLEFEKRAKPTDIALQEMLEGKIAYRYKEKEEEVKKEEE